MGGKHYQWCAVTFFFVIALLEESLVNGSFCLDRDDADQADAMLHLIDAVAKIKCGRQSRDSPPIDCADWLRKNASSGQLQVYPNSRLLNSSMTVYCDMDDDGGGWTVIQRRGNYSNPVDYFYRDWEDYKSGFGNLSEDFWLGNDNIHILTNQRAYQLKFVLTDWDNVTVTATYDNFYIDNEARNYIFSASNYRGTAGDSFSNRAGIAFSTRDRNIMACARNFQGAWWYLYGRCTEANPNGLYHRALDNGNRYGGITWRSFRGDFYSLKETTMKIRPMRMPGT